MWHQVLFSKKVTLQGGGIDEYHVLTSPSALDLRYFYQVQKAHERTRDRVFPFMQDCGSRFLVGVDGFVPAALADSEYGYERRERGGAQGRVIRFTHGFLAAKQGSTLPDLGDLLASQRAQLQEILTAVNSGNEPFAAIPVTFSRRRRDGSAWDEYASRFESGSYAAQGAVFSDTGDFVSWLDEIAREEEKKTSPDGIAAAKTSRTSVPVIVGLAIVAMIALIVLIRQLR